ncbi:MAG: DinB family protein [Rhizomicrobium sp.]
MANAFLVSLFEFKRWIDTELYKSLCALPAERHRDIIVPIFTLDHAMRVDSVFRARLEGKPEPFDLIVSNTMPDLDALARAVADNDDWYVNYVRGVSDAGLDESIAFDFVSDNDKGRMTRGEMLAHVITHNQSHRGGVGKMLEPLGIRIPSDMFTSYVSAGSPR